MEDEDNSEVIVPESFSTEAAAPGLEQVLRVLFFHIAAVALIFFREDDVKHNPRPDPSLADKPVASKPVIGVPFVIGWSVLVGLRVNI